MEHIYLIVWRFKNGTGVWKSENNLSWTGAHGGRLALNYAEAANAASELWEYRAVECVMLPVPETEAEVNARLGTF